MSMRKTYLCCLGDALAEDLNLEIAESSMQSYGHGEGLCWDITGAAGAFVMRIEVWKLEKLKRSSLVDWYWSYQDDWPGTTNPL